MVYELEKGKHYEIFINCAKVIADTHVITYVQEVSESIYVLKDVVNFDTTASFLNLWMPTKGTFDTTDKNLKVTEIPERQISVFLI